MRRYGFGRRRDRTRIIRDILEEARGGSTITSLIFATNLNYNLCVRYVEFLMSRGLLRVYKGGEREIYQTTKKGVEFLHHYRRLQEVLGLRVTERAPRLLRF